MSSTRRVATRVLRPRDPRTAVVARPKAMCSASSGEDPRSQCRAEPGVGCVDRSGYRAKPKNSGSEAAQHEKKRHCLKANDRRCTYTRPHTQRRGRSRRAQPTGQRLATRRNHEGCPRPPPLPRRRRAQDLRQRLHGTHEPGALLRRTLRLPALLGGGRPSTVASIRL